MSRPGFVEMKCAAELAKDKSAYQFQGNAAISTSVLGQREATFLPPPGVTFRGSGDLGRGAGRRWQVGVGVRV